MTMRLEKWLKEERAFLCFIIKSFFFNIA